MTLATVDPVLKFALLAALALAAISALVMLQVLLLSQSGARRERRREAFETRWRPWLVAESLGLPPTDGALAAPSVRQECDWLLRLWNQVQFHLRSDYKPTKEPLLFDIVQRRADAQGGGAVVGGTRFEIDLSQLALVKERSLWRHATFDAPPAGWTALEFDDAAWQEAPAPLGSAHDIETMSGVAAGANVAYFRKRFDVPDPSIVRDLTLRLRAVDGAVVSLNGREGHRSNFEKKVMKARSGASELAFEPVKLSPDLLRAGTNVLAVEVHRFEGGAAHDLVFDASLAANRADPAEPPSVRMALDDALVRAGQPMRLNVDAVAHDADIRKLTLFVDDKPVRTLTGPGNFDWTPRTGPQRIRVVAEDAAGRTTLDYEWREKDSSATHTSGPSFFVSRSGWVAVRNGDVWSDSGLKRLIDELHEVLANIAQKDDAIH